MIPPALLYLPFQKVRGISSSQVVQEDVDNLTVNLVAGPEFTRAEEERLVKALGMTVGAGVNIKTRLLQEIPRTSAGKFRFVVSQVSREMLNG